MKYLFRAYLAVNDPDSAERFHEGHTKILTDLGIESLTSNLPSWMSDPNVIVVNVTQENGELVGGIRVHRYDGKNDLPLVAAIKDQDQNIINFVEEKMKQGGLAESCGLWNSKKVFGRGISPLLARCSVSITSFFEIHTLVCFSAPYTLKMIKSLGFKEILTVGDQGRLPYPTEKFISSALVIDDIYNIKTATPENLERINSLISNPHQHCVENSQGREVAVEYNFSEVLAYKGEKET
jgi:hypothetical protein